jgi:hypothetical protein
MARRPWNEEELKRARDMLAAGYFYGEIDRLRRRVGSTRRQLEGVGYGSGLAVRSMYIPDGLLAEREALAAARNQCTFTQDFFGDPPPGYSALYGKTGLR